MKEGNKPGHKYRIQVGWPSNTNHVIIIDFPMNDEMKNTKIKESALEVHYQNKYYYMVFHFQRLRNFIAFA